MAISDPVFRHDGTNLTADDLQCGIMENIAGWYYWTETGADVFGPYHEEETARRALKQYGKELDRKAGIR